MTNFKIRFESSGVKVMRGSESLNLYKDKEKVLPLVGPDLYEALKSSNWYNKSDRKVDNE